MLRLVILISGCLLPSVATAVDFETDIEPILKARCFDCHGADTQESQLRLDRLAQMLSGGNSGEPAVVPGKPEQSYLLKLIRHEEASKEMPPDEERLADAQIAKIEQWIREGAQTPESYGPAKEEVDLTHWSFQPVQRPGATGIDELIRQKLAQQGLKLSAQADRRTLIRRLYLVMLGLPPLPEKVDAFVADESEDAWQNLVDEVLASPRYGERWATFWLDLVRFGETHGFETNRERPNAWQYRDWVIQSLNEDKPYDQFVREQIVGDAFGADVATGFLVAGPYDLVKGKDPKLGLMQRMNELDDMINTTGTAFLGLTTGCARCHNHKFDPITQRDYYSMQAVFAGVKHGERPLPLPEEAKQRLAKLEADITTLTEQLKKYIPSGQSAAIVMDESEAEHMMESQGQAKKAGHHSGRFGDANYTWWTNEPGKDTAVYRPRLNGHYRIWISWGSGFHTHSTNARYVLRSSGDDKEIAVVNQQLRVNEEGDVDNKARWSGLHNAGVHRLEVADEIVLMGGESGTAVTADVVVFQPVRFNQPLGASRMPPEFLLPVAELVKSFGRLRVNRPKVLTTSATKLGPLGAGPGSESVANTGTGASALRLIAVPSRRSPVNSKHNEERFPPRMARFVRFNIEKTNAGEACIDELEIYAGDRNVALASSGAKATSSGDFVHELHKLEHINDGKHGNEHSWIVNANANGWVQIEFAKPEPIDRIVWQRDRHGRYSDRTAIGYRIECAMKPDAWEQLASSSDRMPFGQKDNSEPNYQFTNLPEAEAAAGREALRQLRAHRKEKEKLSKSTKIYAGTFSQPGPTHRLYRGEPDAKREQVSPGAITAFASLRLDPNAPEQTRRKALADWITSKDNPLTARVIANRLWQFHFGTGIVDTPSDFGRNGAKPTHPEMLDWLASELMANSWSLKHLHRVILNSATWQQNNRPNQQAMKIDAGSRLLWRFPPRRLEAEAIRDSILSVTGVLDVARMGGPGFSPFEIEMENVRHYHAKKSFGPSDWRRMIYMTKVRQEREHVFGAFDCPDSSMVVPKRSRSTTPLQALNLLNSHFVMQQAELFAERLKQESADVEDQIRRAWQLCFQRPAEPEDVADSQAFIQAEGLVQFARAMLNANEFVFVP